MPTATNYPYIAKFGGPFYLWFHIRRRQALLNIWKSRREIECHAQPCLIAEIEPGPFNINRANYGKHLFFANY